MAQFLLGSMKVLSPAHEAFTAGDLVNVYWDDSTEDFTVTLNGSPFSTAGALLGNSGSDFTFVSGISSYDIFYAIASYSFCDSTSLVWFRMLKVFPEYPFFKKRITANSPVCAVGGGVVCDIHWVGTPVITHATSQTEGGSIQVTADSSNGTVRYSIREPDSYEDASNTTGLISLLPAGEWTVYAIDENDCRVSKTFRILYRPIPGEHYRLQWTSKKIGATADLHDARVRIYEREYIGDLVEIRYGSDAPFMLFKPKQGQLNDKLYPVHPTHGKLSLISEFDYQYLPLFTEDNKKFHAVYEVDEGSGFTPVWSGFFDPNVYRENFVAAPYRTEFLISDNIKSLENEPFTDDGGGLLFGNMKVIKVLSFVLKKTGLNLKIRSGINIFETNHNTAATDDPLDQTYVDLACYRDKDEPFNCWQVLEAILRPFGARIVQAENQWLIYEVDRATTSYAYRVFDADGDYESNSTFDPIVEIKSPSETNRVALIDRDHSLEIIPAYRNIDIVTKLNYIGSIVAGGFEKEDLLSPSSETFNAGQGVFKSEEGFRDWTLRMPSGVSGVSFGRVVVSRRGEDTRTGLDDNDPTRSVGAFFYSENSWSGNLRNAYIESSEKPYQYGPGDELRLVFEYSTPAKPEYEFMVLRFMVKVGTNYLQQDLTWDTTETIYRAYPKVSNSLQKFELTVPVPETDVVVDSTVQVRIYFYASAFFDFGLPSSTGDPADGTDGLTGLDTVVTAGIGYDIRTEVRREMILGTFDAFYRDFYELRILEEPLDPFNTGAILSGQMREAGDYDDDTNPRVWWRLKAINIEAEESNTRRRGVDVKFYVDDISLDALVGGQPPPEELTNSTQISKYLNEDMEVELYNFDVPNITNAKNMYNNYFRLSDGTPTSKWARSGVAESLRLDEILLKVLRSNHSAPTFRLTGSFINEFSRVGPHHYIKLVKAGSSLSASNTAFTNDLAGWSQSSTGETWAWVSDHDGSAEVTLTGAVDSKKIYQDITHTGGYIEFTANLAIASVSGSREDVLFALFYLQGSIIHTEKLASFVDVTSDTERSILHTAFCPGQVDRIGFFIKNVTGTGSSTYRVSEFAPAGKDITEIYQIADWEYNTFHHTYTLELQQQSKAYISLSGIDVGGDNQNGGGTTGRAHSSAYSSAYS